MIRRLSILVLLAVAAFLAGCDSSDSIATVTARAEGTSRAQVTLTALSAATLTRTPTITPIPSATPTPQTATEAATEPTTAEALPETPPGPPLLVTVTPVFLTPTPSPTPEGATAPTTAEATAVTTSAATPGVMSSPVTVTPLFSTPTPSPTSRDSAQPTQAATAERTAETTPGAMSPPVTVTPLFPTNTPTAAATAQPTAEATAEPTMAATTAAMPEVQAEAATGTSVRLEPSQSARAVGLLPKGRAVTVVGRYDGWLQIAFKSSSSDVGWVPQETLTILSGDVAALPLIAVRLSAGAATPSPTLAPLDTDVAWFGQTTLYSLFVRSFRDSDGDGIGDLRGVIEKLDYLQRLGVETIWLLPVWVSPSYHGYDVVDYYAVNPDYGTNDDLIALIEAAHARGMRILLDYVFNHTSNEHPFFKDAYGNPASQYAEYYIWENPEHTRYATFAGVQFMPRLNYASPKVRQFAIDVALHWLDPNGDGDFSDGADGYRCDVAAELPVEFWAELRAAIDSRNPRAVLLGELWTDGPQIGRFLGGGGLNAAFDFPTWAVLAGADPNRNGGGALTGEGDPALPALTMRVMARYAPPPAMLARFTHNHDTNRLVSEVDGDLARARAAAVWLLTAPGIPALYYGEEIGMKGVKGSGPEIYDELRREPMDWYAAEQGPGMATWFRPGFRNNAPDDGISVEEQEATPDSLALLKIYRELGALRRVSASLRSGSYELPGHPALYILQRWHEGEMFLVVINFTRARQTLDGLSSYFEVGGNRYRRTQPMLAQGFSDGADRITLEPAGYALYRASR